MNVHYLDFTGVHRSGVLCVIDASKISYLKRITSHYVDF